MEIIFQRYFVFCRGGQRNFFSRSPICNSAYYFHSVEGFLFLCWQNTWSAFLRGFSRGLSLFSILCTGATICPKFLVLTFLCTFKIFSVCYYLLFLLSSCSSLLILLFLSLLILLFLFFLFLFFFSYILNCLLYYSHAYKYYKYIY